VVGKSTSVSHMVYDRDVATLNIIIKV